MYECVKYYDPIELDEFLEDFIDRDNEEKESLFEVEDGFESVSSVSEGELIKTVKRQKRKYVLKKPREVQIPRVLLLDIRKCYAKMLVNIMNSNDFPLLYGFLDTYFAPNAQHTSTKILRHGNSQTVFNMNVYGCDELAKYWYSFMNVTPDGVTTLHDSTIQHTTGKIVTCIHKDATQIYELRNDSSLTNEYVEYILVQESNHDKVNFSSRENSVVTTTTAIAPSNNNNKNKKRKADSNCLVDMEQKKQTMQSIMRSVESAVSCLRLRQCPLILDINGTFSISTDENKRITRLEAIVEY